MNIKKISTIFIVIFILCGIMFIGCNPEDSSSGWVLVGNGVASSADAYYTSVYVYNSTPYVAFLDEEGSSDTEKIVRVKKIVDGSWVSVGGDVKAYYSTDVRLFVYDDNGTAVPYVAYMDWDDDCPIVKKYNGSSWELVGTSGSITSDTVYGLDLFVYDDNGTAVPYIAYSNADGAFVRIYESSSWSSVGSSAFSSSSSIESISLHVYDDSGSPVPFVSYKINDILEIQRYDGGWSTVGNTSGYSIYPSDYYTSISVYDDNGTPVPYVAFVNDNNDDKISIVSCDYSANTCSILGSANVSDSRGQFPSISVYDDNGTPVPYVAYKDWNADYKSTVKKYTGSSWSTVYASGITEGEASYESLFIRNNNGSAELYVASNDQGQSHGAVVYKYLDE